MDTKIFKKILPDDPSEEDYNYWKKMLGIYILKTEVPAESKLDVLYVLCGSKAFPIIEGCTTFDGALQLLDNKFIKRSTSIMMRHKLQSRKQSSTESIEEFMTDLKSMARKCPTKALTADQHRDLLICDSFVSGIHSPTIRQRLLESPDDSIDNLLRTATTMESAMQDAKSFEATFTPPPSFTAAVNNQSTQRPCFWCGGQKHIRSTCPALHSTCKKCQKKGHWSSVCLSKHLNDKTQTKSAATSKSCDPNISDTDSDDHSPFLAATRKTKGLVNATINSYPVQALIDTGSDISFVTSSYLNDHGIKYYNDPPSTPVITLADKSKLKTIGTLDATVCVLGSTHSVKLTIVTQLVAPLIVGLDILRQYSDITIDLGGHLESSRFCLALSTMNTQPYSLIPGVDISKLKPIAMPSRRHVQHQTFIEKEIERLLENDIIQESQSPWRSQCFVVNASTKPRLVINYSDTINKYTPLDSYPSSRIESVVEKIATDKYFSTIDLRSAYHQIPLRPEEYHLTAFEANGKLYEFKRLPFGCTNAVAIFQRTMDNFIDRQKLKKTTSYLDDVTVSGKTQQEHDDNLSNFKAAAEKDNLQLNDEKCVYNQTSIRFLGHIISEGTMKPDPERYKALMDFPNPTSTKELNRLIGLFAYYAKWIPNCSKYTQELTNARETLIKTKELPDNAIAAIQHLKTELASATLAAPIPGVPMTLETDASDIAIGGTLSQDGRPVAFMSRTLSKSERNQSTVEREACAIVECCRKWRHLLLSSPHFVIITDQESASFLFDSKKTSKIKNEKIIRWRLQLSEFQFSIEYRPGTENKVADALSRCSAVVSKSNLITLHEQLCHPGITRLAHYCKSRNLPYSVQEIRDVVSNCNVCRELKPKFYQPPDTNLISATRPWERLSIDFVGPLPSNTKNRYLLVIVDEYSRYPFAFPCSDITEDTVIQCLLQLFSLFGTPGSVHSDKGSQFLGRKVWHFLLKNGVAKTRTCPYRPQGNGQCERINGTVQRTINLALRSFSKSKEQWEKVLPAALSSIRSLLCTSTNSTPHDRLMKFQRSSVNGTDLPEFLLQPGEQILHRRHIKYKGDPPTETVKLVETISPYFARVEFPNGRIDTVSTRHLAPGPIARDILIQDEDTYQNEPHPDVPENNFNESLQQDQVPKELTLDPQPLDDAGDNIVRTRSGRIVKSPVRYAPS